jgi:hypothetical protein
MMKTFALMLALGAATTLLVGDAAALPLAQVKQTAAASDLTLVREGCGRGFQYSERLGRCVRDTPRAMLRDAIKVDRCGPGRHYSERFARCVRN